MLFYVCLVVVTTVPHIDTWHVERCSLWEGKLISIAQQQQQGNLKGFTYIIKSIIQGHTAKGHSKQIKTIIRRVIG